VNRLIAQLTRELKRSPLKAAALGGGTLLAIWFWLPLLGDWFGGEADSASAVPAAAVTPVEPTATTPATPVQRAMKPIKWREIVAWKQANAYTKPYEWLAGGRNPFELVEVVEEIEVAEAVIEDQPLEQDLAQEDAKQEIASKLNSLQLTSTLIMPRIRSATINGRVYREGEPIEMEPSAAGATTGGDFSALSSDVEKTERVVVLHRIDAHSVTLQHGNEFIPLQLKRNTNSAIRLELR
jgi:hypothetical protein